MQQETFYKIFQVRGGRPTTLFHGVDGSRTLPLGEWIEAEVEEVHDGSGGTTYQSGFHVIPKRPQAIDYLRQFEKERPLVICKVDAEDIWPKVHSNSPVELARHMRIRPRWWLLADNPEGAPEPIGREVRMEMDNLTLEHTTDTYSESPI